MKVLTSEIAEEIRTMVYDFFVEECEVELSELSDETSITDDLDGDSLQLVEIVEIMKKKYGLNIQLQTVGKYLLKNQADTIGKVIQTANLIYQHENDIVNL